MIYLETAMLVLQVVTVLTIGWLLKSYFPSYFAEKGKNLATKEDFGKITAEVERVRLVYAKDLENTKNDLQERLEAIKHRLTLTAEASKQYQSIKNQAYVEFIKAVAGIAIAQKNSDRERDLESTILLTDAKARIAIYGSKDVLERMGAFFETYGALNSSEAMTAFVDAIQKMREHAIDKDEWVAKTPIDQLLSQRLWPKVASRSEILWSTNVGAGRWLA
jgi:hypothetical protein